MLRGRRVGEETGRGDSQDEGEKREEVGQTQVVCKRAGERMS